MTKTELAPPPHPLVALLTEALAVTDVKAQRELEEWQLHAERYAGETHNTIVALEAEVAALRGDLPEGWKRHASEFSALPTWFCRDDTGFFAEINDEWAIGYHWSARDSTCDWVEGIAPTLLKAIAACKQVRSGT